MADWMRAVRKAAADREEPEPTEVDMIAALNLWRDATRGLRWVEWAGATGLAAWHAIHDRRASSGGVPEVERVESEVLTRFGETVRLHHDFVISDLGVTVGGVTAQTDINFQFGSGASSTVLGDGEPSHYPRAPRGGIDKGLFKRAGYVMTVEDVDTGHPALGIVPAGTALTMPQVKYLIEDRKLHVPTGEMLLWDSAGPRLKSWALRFSKARAELLAREGLPATYAMWMVKAAVTTVLGGLLRSKKNRTRLMRRDWSDLVMTTSEVNAWRWLDKVEDARRKASDAGENTADWPVLVGMRRDSAWWLCGSEPLAPKGLVLSSEGGKWKLDRWAQTTTDMLDAYQAGSPEKFSAALKRADKARRAAA